MKRISKIRLPWPVSADFAQELAALMLGPDSSFLLRQYTAGQILMGAWLDLLAPVNLTSLYNYLQSAAPLDAERFEREGAGKQAPAPVFQEALAKVADVQKTLPADAALSDLVQQAASLWYDGMRKVGADGPQAAALLELLRRVGVEANEPHHASTGMVPFDTSKGCHILVLGNPGDEHGMPQGMFEMFNMMGMPAGAMPSKAAPVVTPAIRIDSSKPALQVFDRQEVIRVLQRMPESASPMDGTVQQRRLLETMANDAGLRQLGEVPASDALDDLDAQFPHFAEVILFVREQLALAGCGTNGQPVLLPPLLLRGDPGAGKTYFAQELARVLLLPFIERDLSVVSEAFVLTGHDIGWKGAKPGIVFEALINGQVANPLILLNEVDKVRDSGAHNSPINAMLSLLEPTSSDHFQDEFIPVAINASKVNWVLTANEGLTLRPALERLEEYHIPKPTPEQARRIAHSVWNVVLKRHMPDGHGFSAELADELVDFMAQYNPRVMRKTYAQAAGKAAYANRSYLRLEDLQQSISRYVRPARAMGFVTSS